MFRIDSQCFVGVVNCEIVILARTIDPSSIGQNIRRVRLEFDRDMQVVEPAFMQSAEMGPHATLVIVARGFWIDERMGSSRS